MSGNGHGVYVSRALFRRLVVFLVSQVTNFKVLRDRGLLKQESVDVVEALLADLQAADR